MFNFSITALITLIFSGVAFAQDAAAPAKPSMLESIFPFFIIFAVFYFLIIRPQAKQRKEHATLLTQLKKGDEVITSSGIYGKIEGLNEKFVTLEVDQGVKLKVLRSQVLGLAKEEAAK
jgi:preprotein translocase subunit YajC